VLTTCLFKPLILHPQTIKDLTDLLSKNVKQLHKAWYYKPYNLYIGGGLLEQIVSGADNHSLRIKQQP
jgi:uncharacterized linocin/CFP29 family protein